MHEGLERAKLQGKGQGGANALKGGNLTTDRDELGIGVLGGNSASNGKLVEGPEGGNMSGRKLVEPLSGGRPTESWPGGRRGAAGQAKTELILGILGAGG